MYSIANTKTKKRINTYIEEWQDKGLLAGGFGTQAKNIYRRTRVKNSEILELLIYGAYIEEQSKLDEYENKIMYEDANYYYRQGQEEVNKTLKKKKVVSVMPDAIFLALMMMPNAKGYIWKDYIQATAKYNADQIFRQLTIDLHQQKELDITNDIYQNLIKRQQNSKLNINGDKISGNTDLTLIGINNKAKLEGIYSFDDKSEVQFVSIEDGKTTRMCKSLNGQRFKVHDWNEFERYSENNQRTTKYRCYGLIVGLNCPPIDDHFHWCRSFIMYTSPLDKEENVAFNEKGNIIINGIKILNNKQLMQINRIALIKNINRMEKVFRDFPILKNRNIKYKVVKENNDLAMAVKPTTKKSYILQINANVFNENIKEVYDVGVKQHESPRGTTYKDIGIHEAGHMASFEIIRKINKNNLNAMSFDYDNNITTDNIVQKAFNNLKIYDTIKQEKAIRNISNYAMTDSSETIAEAFADYYCNKEKANILSKQIISIMKGMMKN